MSAICRTIRAYVCKCVCLVPTACSAG